MVVSGHYLNQSYLTVNQTTHVDELDDIVQMVIQMHFCDWKLVNFMQQLIKIHWCNWEKVSIGWVDGSAPNRWPAINESTLTKTPETIVIVWPHMNMMSDILINIAWSISLTPYQCQVINETNPDWLSMKPLSTR